MLTVVEAYYQGFLKGAILIAAVSLNQILNKEESMQLYSLLYKLINGVE